MSPVTVLAPIKLAAGKSEADLLAASKIFQEEFVAHEPGVLRRELVRKPDGTIWISSSFAVTKTIWKWSRKRWNHRPARLSLPSWI